MIKLINSNTHRNRSYDKHICLGEDGLIYIGLNSDMIASLSSNSKNEYVGFLIDNSKQTSANIKNPDKDLIYCDLEVYNMVNNFKKESFDIINHLKISEKLNKNHNNNDIEVKIRLYDDDEFKDYESSFNNISNEDCVSIYAEGLISIDTGESVNCVAKELGIKQNKDTCRNIVNFSNPDLDFDLISNKCLLCIENTIEKIKEIKK